MITEVYHPDGSMTVLADPRPLSAQQLDAQARLSALRVQACATFSYGGASGVQCDDTAQQRLTSTIAAMALPSAPATVDWEMTQGQFVAMSLPDLQAFAAAMFAHVQAAWSNKAALSAQIDAAPDPAALYAIDLTQGWPPA